MAINYSSTRGGENNVTASMAILKGLAADGGLFMPDHIPALDCSLEELSHKTYQEVAYAVMKQFLTDFTEEELKTCIERAYDVSLIRKRLRRLSKQTEHIIWSCSTEARLPSRIWRSRSCRI